MTVVGRHSHSLPLTLYSTFVVPGLSFPSPSFLTTTTITTTTTTTTTTTYYSSLLSLFSPLPKENNNLPAYSSTFDFTLSANFPSLQLSFRLKYYHLSSYIRLTLCPDLLSGAWLRAHVPCSSSTLVFLLHLFYLFYLAVVWLHQRPQDDSSPSVRSNDNRATASR